MALALPGLSAAPGSSLEMLTAGLHPRPVESETGGGPAVVS